MDHFKHKAFSLSTFCNVIWMRRKLEVCLRATDAFFSSVGSSSVLGIKLYRGSHIRAKNNVSLFRRNSLLLPLLSTTWMMHPNTYPRSYSAILNYARRHQYKWHSFPNVAMVLVSNFFEKCSIPDRLIKFLSAFTSRLVIFGASNSKSNILLWFTYHIKLFLYISFNNFGCSMFSHWRVQRAWFM